MQSYWLRFVVRAVGPIAVVGSFLLANRSAPAQSPSTEEYTPTQLIRGDNLALFAEFDGLDAHAEGWRKTAAYRLLNETTTGSMLEDLAVQVFPKLPLGTLSGADKLHLVKHLMQAGFMVGTNVTKEDDKVKLATVIVFRGAFSNKAVRPIFARLLQELPQPGTKPQSVVKAGHKMVTGQLPFGPYFWWVEETRKEDLILVLGLPGAEEYVLETLEGKKATVLNHPIRTALIKRQEGMERTGLAFVDAKVLKVVEAQPTLGTLLTQLKTNQIDFVGGFQGDALQTVTRVHGGEGPQETTTGGVAFEKATIPAIPSGALGLMVMAFDRKAIATAIHENKVLGPQYEQWVANLKDKSKVRFEEDVLGQLGPKLTTYIIPARPGGTTAPTLPGALSLLTKLGAGGTDAIPKVALLIDVTNSTAFSQTLDETMSYVNKQLKSSFAPPPSGPESAPPARGRGRGPGAPSPEFRVMSGESKSYVFTVPPELSGSVPASFRPTIRLGTKQLAVALSADAARQALEAKGTYAPPPEIAAAFGKLPARLNWLLVADPRDSTPDILAALPAKLQAGINTLQAAIPPAVTAPGAEPKPVATAPFRKPSLMMGTDGAGSPPPPAPTTPASEAAKPATAGNLVLQVDPSKLPAADAIRRILFPAIYTIDTDGDAVRFTSRAAFPPLPDPAVVGLLARAYKLRQNPAALSGLPGAMPSSTPATSGATSPSGRRGNSSALQVSP